ncbi:elongation factor G-like protein EF-G2 [Pilimelia columellifera]|uniref:Elongation factor G-like protein EF-G2 n=1 Tax=Pilimelia columellifera subsp. columellifera TaxID=706583 RepID=A0ABN3NMG7_9ACTN
MASKGHDRVAAAPTAASTPAAVRNIVLVGHSGAGKTTLVEALLAAAGAITRPGSVAEGTTVCDTDPAAIKQQRSVALACAPLTHRDVKINLLDAPGYADFVGELRAGLRAADAALFVVSAVDGMDTATAILWEECAAVGLPRAVAITRLDHPRADFDEMVALCQRVFGGEDAAGSVLPLLLPMHGDDGESIVGLMSLVDQRVLDYSAGTPATARPAEPQHLSATSEFRDELLEGIIAESEDETLMDRYLAGEPIDPAVVVADLEKAVARGHFYPVIPVSPTTGVGLDALLDLLVRAFPSPLEHGLPPVTGLDGSPRPPMTCDPDGPLVAEVVKTTVDPYLGRVSLVRVFSGTLRPELNVHIAGHGLADRGHPDHDADERITHVYAPLGTALREIPGCVAGDICAIAKSATAETGDTISGRDEPLLVSPWDMPEPLLPVAVAAHTRADEDALARNLAKLTAGDPTLRLDRDADTGQLVLWCMGEAHAEVVLDRLRAGGAEVDTEPVRVRLRETFAAAAKGHGRLVKQSGGHGQYAVVDLEITPLPRGAGVEFLDSSVGGAVPRHYVPAVEKGVRTQLQRGLFAGHPVVDVRVTLVDGKAHSVDSSDMAFQNAAQLAVRDAAESGQLMLLEPVDEVTVRAPQAHLGAVMSDLTGRRGRVLGTETDPEQPEIAVVRAETPAIELLRYAVELRSATSGAGRFRRSFLRYEPMPDQLAEIARREHPGRG